MLPSFFPRNRWLKYLLVLILLAIAVAFFSQAYGQTSKYFSDHGTLTVSPDSITYEMGHRTAAFPNVLLAQHLPRMNEYQFAAHDIALLVDNLALKGVEVQAPASPIDSLRNAVDSLALAIDQLMVDLAAERDARLAAEAALAPVTAERDALAAENAYALEIIRRYNRAIRNR